MPPDAHTPELPRSAKPDPKPRKRYRATKQEWADMHLAFKGSPCRVCGEPFQSLHHALPKSLGGDDVLVNLAPLCGAGTTGCHGLIEARHAATRAALRRNLTDANRWYLEYRLGERADAWLDRNYPELGRVAA